jgi:AsmA protein
MSGKLKWVAIVVVALILILFILPFLIPVNKFKPTIEAKASEALGRKVELGNLSLSIFRGALGIDAISIADDPKFSNGPFLTAKKVDVGVELMPLIFSQQLNVTDIEIVNPQVTMLRNPSGQWNFSAMGASGSSASKANSSNSTQNVSIGKLQLKDGQITLGNTNSQKRSVYSDVNVTATDVAMTNRFPVNFSMGLPGGGTMKVDGNAGPVDQKDATVTPQDVKVAIHSMNLASTGFLDPKLGLSGMVDVTATLVSQSGVMATKGQLTLTKAVLVAGGQPSTVPLVMDFDTKYDLAKGTGVLNPSVVRIGNAKSNLDGTYKSAGDDFVVDLKLNGQGLPATDLESFLPALGINLPSGSKLTAGTLSANLRITGPTNQLVTDGTIGLFNGKLSGFDLGSKMSTVGSLAGIKTGQDLVIEKFTSNVHMAPAGLKADNINLVVPSLGTVVGGGTLDSKNNLNFNLVATVNSALLTNVAGGVAGGAAGGVAGGALGGAMGSMGSMVGGGTNCKNGGVKVPLQVHGTTQNPQITPDVGGATAGMLKSELTCAGGTAGAVPGLAGNLTKNPGAAGAVGALGGLLGGKKKPN